MLRTSSVVLDISERIYSALQAKGARQVRLHAGHVLTYPADAPRGYGIRGALVGVYTANARLEWIAEDLSLAMSEES